VIIPPSEVPAELEPYAGRWELSVYPAGLAVYTAEKRGPGGTLRYIVAPTPRELAGKLAAAEGTS
jgi:hypothetical protein